MRRLVLLGAIFSLGLSGTAQAQPPGHALREAASALSIPTALCPAGVPTQTITVVNQANVRAFALARVENAVVAQSMQLRAAWGTPCVVFGAGGWPLQLDATQDATDLALDPAYHSVYGYHADDVLPDGRVIPIMQAVAENPPGWRSGVNCPGAGLADCKPMWRPWSVPFSHEIVETLVDPSARGGEICDPVQDGSYRLRGVWVADFVTPAWTMAGSSGPWDQMRHLDRAGETW